MSETIPSIGVEFGTQFLRFGGYANCSKSITHFQETEGTVSIPLFHIIHSSVSGITAKKQYPKPNTVYTWTKISFC